MSVCVYVCMDEKILFVKDLTSALKGIKLLILFIGWDTLWWEFRATIRIALISTQNFHVCLSFLESLLFHRKVISCHYFSEVCKKKDKVTGYREENVFLHMCEKKIIDILVIARISVLIPIVWAFLENCF